MQLIFVIIRELDIIPVSVFCKNEVSEQIRAFSTR